jgi:DHA2 family multidrug resistance protein
MRGTALGLTVQTTFVSALSVVVGPALARGAALVNATRNVVQSMGVAILATVLAAGFSPATRALQHAVPSGRGVGVCERANRIVDADLAVAAPASGSSAGEGQPAPRGFTLADVIRACDESVAGFARTYRLTFLAALGSLLLATLLPGWPGRWGGRTSYVTVAEVSP